MAAAMCTRPGAGSDACHTVTRGNTSHYRTLKQGCVEDSHAIVEVACTRCTRPTEIEQIGRFPQFLPVTESQAIIAANATQIEILQARNAALQKHAHEVEETMR